MCPVGLKLVKLRIVRSPSVARFTVRKYLISVRHYLVQNIVNLALIMQACVGIKCRCNASCV